MDRHWLYKGFFAWLVAEYGLQEAKEIWAKANQIYAQLKAAHPHMDRDSRMMILPAAALYRARPEALPLLRSYGAAVGENIAKVVHALTSIPGVPRLLWKHMPKLMRSMSSPEKGYERRIVSETAQMVGVDILSCPLHRAAQELGVPEAAAVVCAMDKAYMTGFRCINYTRTTALGEGDDCCDYRLRFDPDQK